jgi:hypothetical protein
MGATADGLSRYHGHRRQSQPAAGAVVRMGRLVTGLF